MNSRASSTVYSNGTGQSSASRYDPNGMPGQIQQAGNHLQPDIGNFVTGVDQHARQYTPEAGVTLGSGSLPGSSHAKLKRRDELDSPNQLLARLQAQLGGKDDQGNSNQEPSSTNFVKIDPGSYITSVSVVSSEAHDDGINEDHAEQVDDRIASTSGSSQITRSSSSEKVLAVPVNYNTEVPAHFHQKCPVEMSYYDVTKYFSHENNTPLGAGGFGKVYEGTVTVSLLSRCVMVSDGDKREG